MGEKDGTLIETIGKYRLVRKLAEGGMAEVFLAQVEGPGGFLKSVVVKRVLPELSKDQSFVAMFMSEAKLVAQLNHPNIVQVFDFGIHDGRYFLVMEFVDGFNLRAAKQPLPFELAARMVAGACEGLGYAHGFSQAGTPLNLIHRDISPENLLVGSNGVVKVADFGIARVAGQKRMTRTGTVRGKLVYMAPEQMQGQSVDCRVDVFALGIVLYELICGRRPFEAKTEVEAMRAILSGTMIPASTWRPDMPPELQQIIDKAMAHAPEDRFADCAQLQTALERFIAMQGVVANTRAIGKFVEQLAEPAAQPAAVPVTVILPPRELATIAARPASLGPPAHKKAQWLLLAAAVGIAALGGVAALRTPRAAHDEPMPPPAVVVAPIAAEPVVAEPVVDDRVPPPPPAPPRPGLVARVSRVFKKAAPVAALPPREPAKLGSAAEEPVSPALAAPAPTALPKILKGRLSTDSTKGVILHNDSDFPWTGCEVRLPFGKSYRFDPGDSIEPHRSDNIRLGSLEVDGRTQDKHLKAGWATVRCVEASAYLWWGPSVP